MLTFSISIIIPVKPDTSAERVTSSLKKVNYPKDKLEIFVIEGNQPAIQRNRGAAEASGDILYFLDNDSMVDPELFNEVNKAYSNDGVCVVGGPDLMLDKSTFLQQVFNCAFGSYFSHGPMRARYRSIGKMRKSNEKELIGCNLGIKRDIFKKAQGFNENLYPNEENELLNRLKLSGHGIIYGPRVFTYRSRATSVSRLARQLFKYGMGRAKQVLNEPFYLNWIFFLPLLFFGYLIILIFRPKGYFLIPAALYCLGALVAAGISAIKEKKAAFFAALLFIYPIMHISYSLGLLAGFLGMLSPLKAKREPVLIKVNKIKSFGEKWSN